MEHGHCVTNIIFKFYKEIPKLRCRKRSGISLQRNTPRIVSSEQNGHLGK